MTKMKTWTVSFANNVTSRASLSAPVPALKVVSTAPTATREPPKTGASMTTNAKRKKSVTRISSAQTLPVHSGVRDAARCVTRALALATETVPNVPRNTSRT